MLHANRRLPTKAFRDYFRCESGAACAFCLSFFPKRREKLLETRSDSEDSNASHTEHGREALRRRMATRVGISAVVHSWDMSASRVNPVAYASLPTKRVFHGSTAHGECISRSPFILVAVANVRSCGGHGGVNSSPYLSRCHLMFAWILSTSRAGKRRP